MFDLKLKCVGVASGRLASAVLAASMVVVSVAAAQTAQPSAPPKPAPAAPPKQAPAPARPDASAKEKPTTQSNLPSARSIVDRHVEAIGGREAVLGHSSSHATGSMTVTGSGITGVLDIYGAKPDKSLIKINLGGIGDVLEGFDGVNGWSLSPMTGPMLTQGKELEEKKFRRRFLQRPARGGTLRVDEDGREDDVRWTSVLQGQPRQERRGRGLRLLRCRNRSQGWQRWARASRRWDRCR